MLAKVDFVMKLQNANNKLNNTNNKQNAKYSLNLQQFSQIWGK